jgi:uncharacterized protein
MKLKTLLIVSITACAAFFSSISWAEPATEKTIRALMETTGAGALGTQMMQQMLPGLKKMVPNAPEEFWTDFMKEVNADEMIALVIPIYQKNFTEADLLEAVTFYKSPAGQRLITKLPIVSQESFQVGQQWGQELAKRVLESAKKKKIDLTKS